VAQQGLQLLPGDVRPVGAAENPDQGHLDAAIPRAGLRAVGHGFHHGGRVQAVRLGHEPRAEAQLDVGEALALRILDALVRHPAAGVQVHQDAGHPAEAGDERQHTRLGLRHLDVRAQPFYIPGGQRQVVAASQVEDRRQADAAVQVTVQVNQREGRIDHGCSRLIHARVFSALRLMEVYTISPHSATANKLVLDNSCFNVIMLKHYNISLTTLTPFPLSFCRLSPYPLALGGGHSWT
jgi:hypothetical protein